MAFPAGVRPWAQLKGCHQTHALVCIRGGRRALADVLLTVGVRHANVLEKVENTQDRVSVAQKCPQAYSDDLRLSPGCVSAVDDTFHHLIAQTRLTFVVQQD